MGKISLFRLKMNFKSPLIMSITPHGKKMCLKHQKNVSKTGTFNFLKLFHFSSLFARIFVI